ncbi:RDD family protein [Psychrobacillus sp. NEAU-3TGS]|uniref:RDD family protein n=1 Tax=Psychrobacillus sp. NEAU-3TGS TaxID=2995412 RepID=UPI0024995EEE|nr:RDD family protein [Psychrobacillus sp. NEAU-3TGS]MDI2586137.1 RDD family protein [Psychrobacillus sp. NEAU-3TGS]
MSEIIQPDEQNVQEKAPVFEQAVVNRTEQYEHKAAGFWIRFWAYTVDILILSSVGMLIIKPVFRLFSLELNDPVWYAPFSLITAFLFYAYFVLMTKFCSQTVGKMIFGIRVISKNGVKLTWSTVIFREWIGRLISTIPLSLPYIAVAFTPKKQAIHDFIADTLVVHEAVYDKKEKLVQEHTSVAKELQEQNVF